VGKREGREGEWKGRERGKKVRERPPNVSSALTPMSIAWI